MGNPGLPRWLSGIESTCQCRRHRFDPWVRKLPWGREWKSTPVFFPGKFPGQWSLVAYSPWGCKKSDKREQLNRHAHSPMAKRDFSHCRELDRALSLFSSWYWNCSKDQIEYSWGWWGVCWFPFWLIPPPSTEHSPFFSQGFLQPFRWLLSKVWEPDSGRSWFSVWSVDQQHWHHLPACWKCRFSGPFWVRVCS